MLEATEANMTRFLAVAALAAGLVAANAPAHAQNYTVNSRTASPAEVQLLVSYGFQPGHWKLDGFGISPAQAVQKRPMGSDVATDGQGRACRYVLDVLLCD
jgi:hypothetical protein